MKPIIITIDGPAGSGKSTVSLAVARELGLPCLNSGAIYRAVTLAVTEAGGQFDDPAAVERIVEAMQFDVRDGAAGVRYFIGDRDVTDRLKDPDVTAQVYRIANEPAYRRLLVERQKRFGEGRGCVAEGRDMGTVIFPHADVKFFLDAPPEARARRQHAELLARGVDSAYEDVLAKLRERDHRDRSREAGPLVAAADAVLIDTGGLGVDEVVACVLRHVAQRLPAVRRR